MTEDNVDNGQKTKPKKPEHIGKDKVKLRREQIVTDIIANPDGDIDMLALSVKYNVGVRTIRRDMASPEVVNAVDETNENNCDGLVMHHAWRNVRNRIIQNKDVDLSVWLIQHRAKQANVDRMFEKFQREFAQELAATIGMPLADFDAQEMVKFDVTKPNIGFTEN